MISFTALSQKGIVAGVVVDSKTNEKFPGVTILMMKSDTVVTGASTDSNGAFSMSNVPFGKYDVIIKYVGYRDMKRANILVSNATHDMLIAFPGPCKYTHIKGKRLRCVGGHMDHIVPIVYGLPDAKLLAKAKAGKIYLGGCQLYECHAEYYCTTHQLEL
ncbi:hypothetical protein GCM10022409_10910 [Hymenobacter glaciei]|uniref:TonB-dependent receptor plug domain-containing protein n=1 Tax=Hymenobacter glaciei TaxID=877209 RepID=A0ABP7TNL2_9BACT